MWKNVQLGDLYDVGSSKRVLKADWKDEGVPFYRGREITSLSANGYVDNDLFITEQHYETLLAKSGVPKADDIMITAIGTIGNTYIVQPNQKFYFKDASVLWLRKKTDISSKYVQYWLKTDEFFNQLDKGNGATVDTLTIKKLASVVLPLPPLAEQQRIVAKLDAAFAEIDKAAELSKKNKEDALLIYSHTIDELFDKYSKERASLGSLCSINYGYTAKASHDKGTYKLLRITDIQSNTVDWESVPYCEVEPKKLAKVLLHDGDIVFARTGATTGKSFLVETPENAVFASYLIRVSADRDKLIPRYVMHYFQSATYWQQVVEGTSGAAQGGFNATKLSELQIPLAPKEIQEALIKKLDDVLIASNQIASIHEEKTKKLSLLKSSLLAQELSPSEAV